MPFVFLLLLLSSLSLGIGIIAPSMQTEPRLTVYGGNYTEIMQLLFPEEFESTSYSMVDGISLMWLSGAKGIAALIFGFSIVFPVVKLLILWFASLQLAEEKPVSRSLGLIEKLGKFSMVDVFVVSVFIVTIKGLPGGSQIHAKWGLYVFSASVILSMIVGLMLSHRASKIEE